VSHAFVTDRFDLTGRTPLQKRNATVAVIGAGDYIGGEIAKKFASEGFAVFAAGETAPSSSRW